MLEFLSELRQVRSSANPSLTAAVTPTQAAWLAMRRCTSAARCVQAVRAHAEGRSWHCRRIKSRED